MSFPIEQYKAIPCDLFYSKSSITTTQTTKENIKTEKPTRARRNVVKKVENKKAPKSKRKMKEVLKESKQTVIDSPLIEQRPSIELDMNANEIPPLLAKKVVKKSQKSFKIFTSKNNTDVEMHDSESELEKSIQDYKDNFEEQKVEKFQRSSQFSSNDSFTHDPALALTIEQILARLEENEDEEIIPVAPKVISMTLSNLISTLEGTESNN